MTERPTIDIPGSPGGWLPSWPNVAEIEAAAYQTDTRDRDRHLVGRGRAAVCCLQDPYADRDQFAGSDRARVEVLRQALPEGHAAWRALAGDVQGQAALRILAAQQP